ncbi:zf-HC2 domain-containing protein [Crossiella cryophila]|uniref:Anti-sigma factor RsiW n=1 Tax=Crossiella cryophila TaxID=43355 RepID=A0A7W7CHV8_9PSEU|nr:zf-HC2 domain-containing protein [Crossiella cryophila]MBB4681538.1 anti-sigma factor RsiW [Crossiella cryophila]
MSSPPDHSDVGAYLLGVLNEADTIAFEEHLTHCSRCQDELQELLDLPDLLDTARALGQHQQQRNGAVPPPQVRPNQPRPQAPPGRPLRSVPPLARPQPGPQAPRPRQGPPPAQPRPPAFAPATPAPAPEGPDERVLAQLLDQVGARKRDRRKAVLWSLAAAACLALVLTPLVVSATTGDGRDGVALPSPILSLPSQPSTTRAPVSTGPVGPSADASTLNEETLTGSNPANNVSAILALTEKGSGVEVRMELKGISGPRRCQLVAIGKAGETFPVNSWVVPEKGYGVAGSPEPLRNTGNVALSRTDIASFEVRTMDGIGLLSIPAGG